MKETENLRNLLGTINHTNICIMSPGRKREKGKERVFEEIRAKIIGQALQNHLA